MSDSRAVPGKDSPAQAAGVIYLPIEPAEIRRVRQESGLSQAGFARLLVTHKRTIQRWEAGTMRPTGAALALLTLVCKRGIQVLT